MGKCPVIIIHRLTQCLYLQLIWGIFTLFTKDLQPVDDLWSLQVIFIGIKGPMIESDDHLALHKFSIRFEDGSYQITWPWKGINTCLPDNYVISLPQ